MTIRTVLRRSGIDEEQLDFVVPVPVGAKKIEVLEGMLATRYREALLCADEIGDYHAACVSGYESLIGTYGFDARERLLERGEIPAASLYDTPAELADALRRRVAVHDAGGGRQPTLDTTLSLRSPVLNLVAHGR